MGFTPRGDEAKTRKTKNSLYFENSSGAFEGVRIAQKFSRSRLDRDDRMARQRAAPVCLNPGGNTHHDIS
jgi:hypothetical protein